MARRTSDSGELRGRNQHGRPRWRNLRDRSLAPEVKELVKTIDWDQVLQGQTPYKDLSFRRKQDAAEYPNRLEFGLKKGLQFPEGFNSGQDVVMILDRVALPYSEVQDFNDLPIPFACVATDLVTSQPFVFREGSLSSRPALHHVTAGNLQSGQVGRAYFRRRWTDG